MQRFSIGKLAKAAQVAVDTIRFYEKCGVLAPPARKPSGFREYTEADLQRLLFVRQAREVGFSIEEITQLLVSEENDPTISDAALDEKLRLIERKVTELRQWHVTLLTWRSRRPEERKRLSIVDMVQALPIYNECPPGCACTDNTAATTSSP